MDETIERYPTLVDARVVSVEAIDSREYGRQVLSATLEVVQTLKGDVASSTITVEQSMCYASLSIPT